MTAIPDFTDTEQKRVTTILFKHYGKLVLLQLADSELQLGGDPNDLILYPSLYWNERGAHFIVCKTGDSSYRCQFCYSEAEQYSTGHDEYDDLDICVRTLLQVQSDLERQLSGVTAATLRGGECHSPLVA
jgi:hypothetical protein